MRDCFGKIGRDRVQAVHEHAGPGGVVAVAEDAVLIVDPAAVVEVFAELVRTRCLEVEKGVLSGVEIDPLVVHRDLGR